MGGLRRVRLVVVQDKDPATQISQTKNPSPTRILSTTNIVPEGNGIGRARLRIANRPKWIASQIVLCRFPAIHFTHKRY